MQLFLAIVGCLLVASVTPAAGYGCPDVPPNNDYSCAQQKKFGKCDEDFMKGYCNYSCERCDPCSDVPPDSRYTCAEQKKYGKCDDSFIKDGYYCQLSCGRAPRSCPYTHTVTSTKDGVTTTKTITKMPDGKTVETSISSGPQAAAAAGALGDKTDTHTTITHTGATVSTAHSSSSTRRRVK